MNTMSRHRWHKLLAMLLSVVMLLNMNCFVLAEEEYVPSPNPNVCEHNAVDCVGKCWECGMEGFEPTDYHALNKYECDERRHVYICYYCEEILGTENHYLESSEDVCGTCVVCDFDVHGTLYCNGVCTDCGQSGLRAGEEHNWKETMSYDDYNHWWGCHDCDLVAEEGPHRTECGSDVCNECGASGISGRHGSSSSNMEYDEYQHWYVCDSCGDTVVEPHSFSTGSANCNWCAHTCSHSNIDCVGACMDCKVTGLEATENHDREVSGYDAEVHYWLCTACGDTTRGAHYRYCDDTESGCSACDWDGEPNDIFHEIEDENTYYYDKEQHWQACSNCDDKAYAQAHEWDAETGRCTTCAQTETGECGHETINCKGICVFCEVGDFEPGEHFWIWEKRDETYCQCVCVTCGEVDSESLTEHQSSCQSAEGTCHLCESTDVTLREEISHFMGDNSEAEYTETTHWWICSECGESFDEGEHMTDCTGLCWDCGATGLTPGDEHDYDWETICFDDTNHWVECRNCDAVDYMYEDGEHYYWCDDEAEVCTMCGQSDVTFAYISHRGENWWEKYDWDDTKHWYVCDVCNVQVYPTLHEPDETGACYCGATDLAVATPAPEPTATSTAEPTATPAPECSHEQINCIGICAECGIAGLTPDMQNHNYDFSIIDFDEDYHWGVCKDCDGTYSKNEHTLSCTSNGVCTGCGETDVNFSDFISHSSFDEYQYDETHHWYLCTDCDEKVFVEAHLASCSNKDKCAMCGQTDVTLSEDQISHTITDLTWYNDETEHWWLCSDCGERTQISDHKIDSTGTCSVCGKTGLSTATPTPEPTATPTAKPTATPTAEPTATPTAEPTAEPTATPTAEPTAEPTATPTAEPTAEPTATPTVEPTVEPTATPTAEPTAEPTAVPAPKPTVEPTAEPTATPTLPPVPVIVPEKVENKEIEVLEQEINKVVDNIIAEIKAAVKAETEEAAEDETAAEVEVEVKIEVPVEPLKEAVGEETYEQIVQMPVHEKIIVLLSVLGDNNGQANLLKDTGMSISEESKAVVEKVVQSVSVLSEESTAAFQQVLEESFPKQEVTMDDKEFVYYLIPMYVTINDVTQVKYYAFCYDKQADKWLFTVIEEGMDVMEAIEQAQQDAEEAAE